MAESSGKEDQIEKAKGNSVDINRLRHFSIDFNNLKPAESRCSERSRSTPKSKVFQDNFRRKSMPWCYADGAGIGKVSAKSDREENQDFMLCFVNSCGVFIAGIFDGHGKFGRAAAEACSILFKTKLETFSILSLQSLSINQTLEKSLEDKMTELFAAVQDELKKTMESPLNVNLRWSGTTATVLLIQNSLAVLANVGDSQALIASRSSGEVIEIQRNNIKILTKLHRTTDVDEAERIRQAGAKIENDRIYMKDLKMPGIMLTRSLGDFSAHDCIGLSCKPAVNIFELTELDLVLVIASDGVWDFLDPDFALSLLNTQMTAQAATEHLVAEAIKNQSQKHCDNTSAIVVFLEDILQRKIRVARFCGSKKDASTIRNEPGETGRLESSVGFQCLKKEGIINTQSVTPAAVANPITEYCTLN